MQEGMMTRELKRKKVVALDEGATMKSTLWYSSGKQKNGGKYNGETWWT